MALRPTNPSRVPSGQVYIIAGNWARYLSVGPILLPLLPRFLPWHLVPRLWEEVEPVEAKEERRKPRKRAGSVGGGPEEVVRHVGSY